MLDQFMSNPVLYSAILAAAIIAALFLIKKSIKIAALIVVISLVLIVVLMQVLDVDSSRLKGKAQKAKSRVEKVIGK